MSTKIQYLNPEGLSKNPAFSQIVVTEGNGKTIYIGGQNSINAKSEIIGKGDISIQSEQAMKNLETALSAYNATFNDLVKITIYIVQGQDLRKAFEASQKFFKDVTNPPAVSGLFVSALANPDYLIEIDAIAFV